MTEMIGLEEYRHEAGECYTRKIAKHWEDGQTCGDPRCDIAEAEERAALAICRGCYERNISVLESADRHFRSMFAEWPTVANLIDPARIAKRTVAILNGAGPTR